MCAWKRLDLALCQTDSTPSLQEQKQRPLLYASLPIRTCADFQSTFPSFCPTLLQWIDGPSPQVQVKLVLLGEAIWSAIVGGGCNEIN